MDDDVRSFWVLVLSYLWKNLGYDMILWMAGLAGIPEEIYEAAHMDGAGERACFFRITLPNLLPSLYTISVLSFLIRLRYSGRRGSWRVIIPSRICTFCSICTITGSATWPSIKFRRQLCSRRLWCACSFCCCSGHGSGRYKV